MEILMFLNSFEVLWVMAILLVAVVILSVRFFTQPKGERKKELVRWLGRIVILAEAKYGSKKGQLKLAYVYDTFLKKYPALAFFITKKQFEKLVDEALEMTKETINTMQKK